MWRGECKLGFLAVLFVVFGCIAVTSGSFRRPTRVGVICCEQVSKAPIPASVTLVGYKRQNALAPCVEAIIFFSKTEKFCSNSTARWIERRLKGLQEV